MRSGRSTRRITALILTSYDDDEALFAAILAGASGYVLKQIGGNDLVDAVRRVAGGQSLIDPTLTARVLDRLRHGADEPEELATLTDQERKILALIAEGLTNRQIGERMFLAEKTVKNYVSSILRKLGLERRTQAAVLASKLLGELPRDGASGPSGNGRHHRAICDGAERSTRRSGGRDLGPGATVTTGPHPSLAERAG